MLVVSLEESRGYDQKALRDLNGRAETIHSELQTAGAPEYPSTSVDFMDVQDRRDIGEYLCTETGMDYCSSLYVIEQLGMIYREDEDRYIVTEALFDPEVSSDEQALLAHEAGHRLGRKVIEDRMMPLKDSKDVSSEGFRTLVDYLVSENFAERVKVAIGESLGEDFVYDTRFIDNPPEGYKMRARIGPDELVDPSRNEDLEILFHDIDSLLDDLSKEVEDWT